MFALSIRIEPEQELFRFFDDNDTIQSYCTGDKGLLIYLSSGSSNIANLIGENILLVEKEDFVSSSALRFNCDCIVNPPSKIRQIISDFKGIIVNPVVIKNNWEYITLLIETYEDIERILDAFKNLYRIEVLKVENIDFAKSYMYSHSIQELFKLLTNQQRETLVEAWKKGYYKIPRKIKTEKLAQS